MKIIKYNIREIEIYLRKPIRISLGVIEKAHSLILELITDNGLIGFGEAGPSMIITGENINGQKIVLEMLVRKIIGMDPLDIEKISHLIKKAVPGNFAAKAAIDVAIYDIIGKIYNTPLYKLFGGYYEEIKTDITIPIDEPDKMAEKAIEHVQKGFQILKIKVGANIKDNCKRIMAIREAVGCNIKVRIDANQAWSVKEALKHIKEIEKYDIEFIEQPVLAGDLEGLAYITKNSPIHIMADESIFTAEDALKIVKLSAADMINIKLMKCGGITEAIKINSIAESAGISCMLGCMFEEIGVAIVAAAHLAKGLKNIVAVDLDTPLFLSKVLVEDAFNIDKGKIFLSGKNGLGIDKVKYGSTI
jgi:L-alanine-DL-glutamate epimerase-like enolase superfamily enzyme